MPINQCVVQWCAQCVTEASVMKHRPSELPIGLARPQSSIIYTSTSCLGSTDLTANVPCRDTIPREAANGLLAGCQLRRRPGLFSYVHSSC